MSRVSTVDIRDAHRHVHTHRYTDIESQAASNLKFIRKNVCQQERFSTFTTIMHYIYAKHIQTDTQHTLASFHIQINAQLHEQSIRFML